MIRKDKKMNNDEAGRMTANPEAVGSEEAAKMANLVNELTNDLQRTRAVFENYRKQVEAQRQAAVKSAGLATVYKMLPLLDDMARAVETYKELLPLKKTLEKTMTELGLSRIPSEEGVEFNPDIHEAVMVEGEGEKEVVAETLRPGYMYGSEVLRPAMVKVKRV